MSQQPEKNKKGIKLSLWIPVTLAFILLIAAWTTLIVIAKKHPTEIVPLEEPVAQQTTTDQAE
ncbi:hypothetical protein [Cerasicoccus maritimus]|uniref:hypothetical protein n=1 Tax=Cerasicoccus maritimus TaxID=490089 RepID=UPI0028528029|nr:hypothetical protein [Cerasicoccus maritimus]